MIHELIRDTIALAALAGIGAGCWQIHPPAALIVVGVVLLVGLVWQGGRRAQPPSGEED